MRSLGVPTQPGLRAVTSLLTATLVQLVLLSTPGAVEALSRGALSPQQVRTELPVVYILSTGGTIASTYDSIAGGFRPALSGEEIVAAVPGLTSVARVVVENVSSIGSADMTPEIWVRLSRRANEILARPEVSGVVVTHGTDTLEETAYFLDLTITSDKPVLLVGAQRAASERDSDGPRNLLNAVRIAVSPEARGMGAMIAMNGQINAAREVTKTSTYAVETFQTLDLGRLGYVDPDRVRFYRAPLRRQTIALGAQPALGRVEIVMHYAGADGRAIRGLLAQGQLDGLVIASTGLGNLSATMGEAIQEVRSRGIPVVIASRVLAGRVVPTYTGPGKGVDLKEMGCVFSDNLSPQKARILLMLAMTRTKDAAGLQEYFDR